MEKIVFSEEEKNEYKKIILELLLDGKYYEEIVDYIGISISTVTRYIKELIKERKNN